MGLRELHSVSYFCSSCIIEKNILNCLCFVFYDSSLCYLSPHVLVMYPLRCPLVDNNFVSKFREEYAIFQSVFNRVGVDWGGEKKGSTAFRIFHAWETDRNWCWMKIEVNKKKGFFFTWMSLKWIIPPRLLMYSIILSAWERSSRDSLAKNLEIPGRAMSLRSKKYD